MSPLEPGAPIQLYGGKRADYLLIYEPGRVFSTHLGNLTLPERLSYGDALSTHTGRRFVALRPSTAVLMMKVRRRTTIIYPKEAGAMLLATPVGSGSRVAEVGSGSGALSVALATVVGETGRVYSFERRPEFSALARENAERFGVAERITFAVRDVAEEGFDVEGVEAVFVDVPEPWTLVGAAARALAPSGYWVSLSPCVEQVVAVTEALEGAGFVKLRTVEILERELLARRGKTRPVERMVSHTGYLTSAVGNLGDDDAP